MFLQEPRTDKKALTPYFTWTDILKGHLCPLSLNTRPDWRGIGPHRPRRTTKDPLKDRGGRHVDNNSKCGFSIQNLNPKVLLSLVTYVAVCGRDRHN